jgi:hypothetical protein
MMKEACLNMGMLKIVAKNDLYFVRQPGMTGRLAQQEKSRAGVDEADWHCMVLLTLWAVAMLDHVSDVAITQRKSKEFMTRNIA